MWLFELDDRELDKRIQEVIKDVTPKSVFVRIQPQPLSFVQALGDSIRALLASCLLGIGITFLLLPGVDYSKNSLLLALVGTVAGILTTWTLRAFLLMKIRRKKIQNFVQDPVPEPDTAAILKLILEKQKSVIMAAKDSVEGERSQVVRQMNKIKLELNEARTILRYWQERFDQTYDPGARSLADEAQLEVEKYKKLYAELEGDQQAALRFFREVETFIPKAEAHFSDIEYETRLRKLQGRVDLVREESRSILLEALRPVFERLVPLELVKQRLELRALGQIEGPSAVNEIIAKAEKIGSDNKLETAVLDIRRKLDAK
ncbi:hypothetical protein KW790_00905 [Candidatus Parcubacteria bacterium]|nr:hypothetical protein [Candidatus Parcubacteria bacterium]